MNAAARGMLALSEGDFGLPSAEIERLLSPETPSGRPIAYEDTAAARALRGERALARESVLHRPDGSRVWVSISSAPIISPNGEPWGAVVAFADVTISQN